MSEWVVKIEYKNENLETVVEKEYDFVAYTELIQQGIKKVISDVEDAFYTLTGNKSKEEWNEETAVQFKRIRNRLLDYSNDIKRLPVTLSHNGQSPNQIPSGEYIAKYLAK